MTIYLPLSVLRSFCRQSSLRSFYRQSFFVFLFISLYSIGFFFCISFFLISRNIRFLFSICVEVSASKFSVTSKVLSLEVLLRAKNVMPPTISKQTIIDEIIMIFFFIPSSSLFVPYKISLTICSSHLISGSNIFILN